jgi:hypothetical protein
MAAGGIENFFDTQINYKTFAGNVEVNISQDYAMSDDLYSIFIVGVRFNGVHRLVLNITGNGRLCMSTGTISHCDNVSINWSSGLSPFGWRLSLFSCREVIIGNQTIASAGHTFAHELSASDVYNLTIGGSIRTAGSGIVSVVIVHNTGLFMRNRIWELAAYSLSRVVISGNNCGVVDDIACLSGAVVCIDRSASTALSNTRFPVQAGDGIIIDGRGNTLAGMNNVTRR